jgi:hypothetical protein
MTKIAMRRTRSRATATTARIAATLPAIPATIPATTAVDGVAVLVVAELAGVRRRSRSYVVVMLHHRGTTLRPSVGGLGPRPASMCR